VVTNARAFYTTRAAAGARAPGIPHALRGGRFLAKLGRIAPRECEVMFNRHCEERSDEAIHRSAQRKLDCFAEPVIGRAFARPVGSQ
jgi:hypothetical protein